MSHPQTFRPERGFALITSMIFLLVLTLVAITAMEGTTLELRMSTNDAMRTEAFEAADSPRQVVSRLVDVHAFARGWPITAGGTVPVSDFDYPMPAGLAVIDARNWYIDNTETDPFSPYTLTPDATMTRTLQLDGQTPLDVKSEFSVYRLRTSINAGSGAAMVAGYEGTGKAIAASGGSLYFYVSATGMDPTESAESKTSANYRHIIRN